MTTADATNPTAQTPLIAQTTPTPQSRQTASSTQTATHDGPLLETPNGTLRGTEVEGIVSFKGVPFAAPPVGANRFRAPQPVEPWQGVRDARRFGPTAPKGQYPAAVREILPEVDIAGDEWLNLNVWAPAGGLIGERTGLPVLVFIHGGSFVNGSGSVAQYDGSTFARDGVVCVTLNYRLGSEGFTYFAAEQGEPADQGEPGERGEQGQPDEPTTGTANRGLLDQVQALEWVRDTIALLGGDPARVTIAGESAGAMSVAALLVMPKARGLFARAILQSGAANDVLSPHDATAVAQALADELGTPLRREAFAALDPADVVSGIARVSARIQTEKDPAVFGKAKTQLPFAPVVDGTVIPREPIDALRAGDSAKIPVLIGWTRDEGRLFFVPSGLASRVDDAALAFLTQGFGLSPTGLAVYRASRPQLSPGLVLSEVMGDFRFARPARALAEAREESGGQDAPAPVWLYRFDGLAAASDTELGSCHASELPFVFDSLGTPGLGPILGPNPPQATADLVHGLWVDFVSGRDLPWAPYDSTTRTQAVLTDHVEAVDDLAGDDRRAWELT